MTTELMIVDAADEAYASRVVHMLLASFPQQKPHDPETYIRQLVTLCVGVLKWVLKEMVNPRDGLLSTAKFLPTIAEVTAFLEPRLPPKDFHARVPEHRRLPPLEEEKISPEERERSVKMLLGVSDQIRQATRKISVNRQMDISSLDAEQREAIAQHIANPDTA